MAAVAYAVLGASVAHGRVCGDPDRSGRVDVIDAANVSRAAVGLASNCEVRICDVDGNGAIDVIDAANVGRGSVGLPAVLRCSPEPARCGDQIVNQPSEVCDGAPDECIGGSVCTGGCACSVQAVARLDGIVLGADFAPIPGVAVVVETTGDVAFTGPDGTFVAHDVPTSRIIAGLPDGSQNVYGLAVNTSAASATAEFVVDPVFGRANASAIDVLPAENAPGGTAVVLDPVEEVECAAPPQPCRFAVAGSASPSLGQPGTDFNLYVFVTPTRPSGGGTFPQFPAVSVDPVTGAWQAEAQIGGTGPLQPPSASRFQLLALVTDVDLEEQNAQDPLRFDRPIDVPGVVHISPFTNLTVGSRPGPSVMLAAPDDRALTTPAIEFEWIIENPLPGTVYCSTLITDKGCNPFDGGFEESFEIGQATKLDISLDPTIYEGVEFEWGVRVACCEGDGASCDDVGTSTCETDCIPPSNIRSVRVCADTPTCTESDCERAAGAMGR